MDEWTFHESELARLVAESDNKPWRGSPLFRLSSAELELDDMEPHFESTPGFEDAYEAVARPGVGACVVAWPPDEAETLWFYRSGSGRPFAMHKQLGEEHIIMWPHEREDVLDLAMHSLTNHHFTAVEPGPPLRLELTREALEATVAIIDIMQEDSLLAFLNRTRPAPRAFDSEEVTDCFYRSAFRDESDFRWASQRASLLAPFDLAPSPEDIDTGLSSLVDQGHLSSEKGAFTMNEDFALACITLGDCAGCAALGVHARSGASGNPSWKQSHVAASAHSAGLWLFEFDDISEDSFKLLLTQVSQGELKSKFAALLDVTGDVEEPQPKAPVEATVAAPADVARFCTACGHALKSGATFCTECGAPVHQAPQPSAS